MKYVLKIVVLSAIYCVGLAGQKVRRFFMEETPLPHGIGGLTMAHWIDNADSYICSSCGYECNNPNKEKYGAGVCPKCGAKMECGHDG